MRGQERNDFMRRVVAEIPALQRYARALAADASGADDLLQDGLERALRKADQFESGTNLRAWLCTILRNRHIDGYRKSARRGPHVPYDEELSTVMTVPNQDAHVALNETLPAIAAMDVRDRRVFELAVFDDLPYREVADRLDIAVGTVKSRLSRARRTLASRHLAADRWASQRAARGSRPSV